MYWTITFEIRLEKKFDNNLEKQLLNINESLFEKVEMMLQNYQDGTYDLGSLQVVECSVFSLQSKRSQKYDF